MFFEKIINSLYVFHMSIFEKIDNQS